MLSTSRAWSCTKQDSGVPVSEASRQLPDGIVFLDKDLAVVVKGVGELCQDNVPQSLSRRMRPVIEAALGHGVERCQCVHRLDQPVSGLCILALTEQSLSALSAAFAQGAVQKTYCAVTERFRQQQDSGENRWSGVFPETGSCSAVSWSLIPVGKRHGLWGPDTGGQRKPGCGTRWWDRGTATTFWWWSPIPAAAIRSAASWPPSAAPSRVT